MIEFVTLLLGLVTGSQAVELSVSDQVAAVEFRLDGRFAGVVSSPPWVLTCDFGDDLSPHELVVTAYGSRRQELQTIRQWVNLPRERVEARLALERPADGTEPKPATARLIWAALDHQDPPEVRLTFDGQPLPVDDPEAIALPAHDLRSVHLLRAELVFSSASVTYAELVFGGTYGEEVSTELTALVLEAAKRPPKPEEMVGWLRKGDQPLEVVAVDRGAANLVVVRERSEATSSALRQVFDDYHRRYRPRRRGSLGLPAKAPSAPPVVVGEGDRIRFAYPTISREQVAVGQGMAPPLTEQVPVSRNVTDLGPLFDTLTTAFSAEVEAPAARQQLADAVAIAGLVAAAGDRRRAVLLIRSGVAEDTSRFSPRIVRSYLRRLAVPLVVWSIGAVDGASAAWGEERNVSSYERMRKALFELSDVLKSQVVVWVEGPHLSHEIELTDQSSGLREIS